MGRLIDADAFKTQASAMAVKFNWDTQKAISFLKIIDSQPTAYDVDKVVEQLEGLQSYSAYSNTDYVRLSEVIPVVKGGGRDE